MRGARGVPPDRHHPAAIRRPCTARGRPWVWRPRVSSSMGPADALLAQVADSATALWSPAISGGRPQG
eukprot:3821133-Lingulodinium_polyedra.AAC.1